MRVDANVSVRPVGTSELGTKVEIKNMNSLRSLGRAIDYEIERQVERDRGGRAHRPGDAPLGRGDRSHRLHAVEGGVVGLPLLPRARPRAGGADRRDARRRCGRRMPELPAARRARLVEAWGIGDGRRARARRPRRAGGVRGGGRRRADERHRQGRRQLVRRRRARPPQRDRRWRSPCCRSRPTASPSSSAWSPTAPSRAARPRTCSASACTSRSGPAQVVEERGLSQVSDEGELGAVVDQVLAENADVVEEYRAADDKGRARRSALLMGKAMGATKGQANPKLLRDLLEQRLQA